jgi:hypothetical protein
VIAQRPARQAHAEAVLVGEKPCDETEWIAGEPAEQRSFRSWLWLTSASEHKGHIAIPELRFVVAILCTSYREGSLAISRYTHRCRS